MELFEWYMIRATGTVSYLLLYLSVVIGLYSQVQKKRKHKVTISLFLHEALSNWALILVLGHVGFLLIDSYLSFQWIEILTPFTTDYKPLPMALGTVSLYFLLMTVITSKARKKIGYQKWRKLHALNPILYILVTLHGLFIGTDFQGVMVLAINLLPFLVLGGMLWRNKSSLETYQ
ncbi:sulfoxide reductase heme-binding subunit YedZ [Bacillus sp. SORGH_AS 510]|uniref:ferric reductase-like transmembrane domain-containing protein n=1 Tax=Bacillus sp. SORGH_AS_0510 TaxID=3041771 RepID=UPI0027813A52|nr:ferric reductase-like transmembrane domain-containing protein [Bacillus sp. SORGH_AS_0510]MDQ1144679.1 sulfoxide reductase heme-binding subunit YedZ [Bacillus sp. SORGH_AS_0510]